MTVWEWVTSTTTVDQVLTALGVGLLVFLYSRDLILTKGQHLRRVQDLIDHHQRERDEKDSRADDLRESRDGWKEAARIERERADRVSESVSEMAGVLEDILHVLQSLDRALPHPERGDHERAGQGSGRPSGVPSGAG